jgi:hypothetical protein
MNSCVFFDCSGTWRLQNMCDSLCPAVFSVAFTCKHSLICCYCLEFHRYVCNGMSLLCRWRRRESFGWAILRGLFVCVLHGLLAVHLGVDSVCVLRFPVFQLHGLHELWCFWRCRRRVKRKVGIPVSHSTAVPVLELSGVFSAPEMSFCYVTTLFH